MTTTPGNTTTPTSSIRNSSVPSYTYTVVSSIFMWLLILFIIAGNILAIAAYCKTFRLRAVTRSFIVNLAVTDLLVGIVVMPFWFHRTLLKHQNLHTALYRIWVTFDISCATASIMCLAVLSIDRYIIISKPLLYERLLPKSCAPLIIFLIWVYAIGLALLRELNLKSYGLLVTTFAFVLPVSVMVFAYVNIFKVAKFQADRIFRDRAVLCNDDSRSRSSKRFEKELKATKTISLVIGAFLLCWMPFFIVSMFGQYCKTCKIFFELVIVVKWLHYANSAINPVIYAMHNRDFRDALRAIYNRKRQDLATPGNSGPGMTKRKSTSSGNSSSGLSRENYKRVTGMSQV